MRNFAAEQADVDAAIEELSMTRNEDRIDELARNHDIKVQKQVIFHAYVSAKTLDRLARKAPGFENKLLWISEHSNTSPETLEWIYKRSKGKGFLNTVRRWFSPASPEKEEEIRKVLASNVNTPTSVIRSLINDDSADVRLTLARNLTIPNSVIADLTHDLSPHVRLALAYNVNIPRNVREELLTGLLASLDKDIQLEALDSDELPDNVRAVALTELSFEDKKDYWNDLAALRHLDMDTVRSLSLKGDAEVKKALFNNENLPAPAYELLAQEESFHLLELLGDNPGVPQDILESLAITSIEALKEMERLKQYTLVAIAVATNPSTPKSALKAFADMAPAAQTDGALPGVDAGEEEELMDKSIPAQLRYLALHNPNYKK
jgi:hypothetical protein